jgi:hypothetical protein
MDIDSNLKLMIYQKCFVSSIVALTDLLYKKGVSLLNNNNINKKSLDKLLDTCIYLLKEYKGENDDVSELNQGRVIKKVYTTLKSYVNLLKDKDISLFSKKNEQTNAIITIIPGLNIGLIIEYLDDLEKKYLWEYIYLLFCYSAHLVAMINNKNKEGELWDIINKLEKEVCNSDVIKRLKFNPYIGIQSSEQSSVLDVDNLITNSQNIVLSDGNSDNNGLLNMIGADKMLNKEQLMEQLKNLDEKQINEVTNVISDLFGGNEDKDVSEVTNTLVHDIVNELKKDGISSFDNMYNIASKVSERMANNMDQSKVKKTGEKMKNMMENCESRLKNMKDGNGKPIGEDLLNQFAIPLKMAQSMGMNLNKKKK